MKLGRLSLWLGLSLALVFCTFGVQEAIGGGGKPKFSKYYIGTHGLGVNRVNNGKRVGKAKVTFVEGRLELSGKLSQGKYSLEIWGDIEPHSRREFLLRGKISGTPNLEFKGQGPKAVSTEGTFLFKAKGKRRYWRMYEVNGADCVCGEGCGNDFCYIDLDFGPPKKR